LKVKLEQCEISICDGKAAVLVDVVEVLKELRAKMGLGGYDLYITTHNDVTGIFRVEDVSYHGSPIMEYTLLRELSCEDVEVFKYIEALISFLEANPEGRNAR